MADASQDWSENPPIPQAVLESVHGGEGAKKVAELDQTNPDGTANTSAAARKKVAGTTFGDPVRYVFMNLVAGSTAEALSPEDLYPTVMYAAVQYVDGVASSVVVMHENGDFMQLGWMFEDIEDVEHVRPTEMLASGGPEGDLYEVSKNLKQVRPLNAVARDIIGNGAMPVEKFRDVKATQEAARVAAYDKDYHEALDAGQIKPGETLLGSPRSLVPGTSPLGTNHVRPTVHTPMAAIGAVLTLVAGCLLLLQVRRRRTAGAAAL
ncbi:hypothetical protein [Cellulomonas sp. URHB0016]